MEYKRNNTDRAICSQSCSEVGERAMEPTEFQQTQEIAGASIAQDDFYLAYRLQLEEALQASCHDLGLPYPESSPSTSHVPVQSFSQSDQYKDYGCDLSPPDRALALAIQKLELSRSQQEAEDHRLADTERQKLWHELQLRAHDRRLAQSLESMENYDWEDSESPHEAPFKFYELRVDGDGIQDVCGLYVTSIMALVEESFQPCIGVVVMGPCGNVMCEVRKPLESGLGKVVADYKALLTGLEDAMALNLQYLLVHTDSVLMYNQVTGRWKIRSQKVKILHAKVMQLTCKLGYFNLALIPRSENGHALKLAREALHSATMAQTKETEAKEDCSICFEGTKFSEMIFIFGCFHRFCRSCIVQHAEVKVQSGQVPIRCPQINCTQTLSLPLSKSILSPKWYELLNKRIIEAKMPEAERVYCPYPKCSALMSRKTLKAYVLGTASSSSSSSSVTSASCIECFRVFCVECRVPWHGGMTCQQYQQLPPNRKDAQDANLYKLAENQKWQRCKVCRRMIELAEGCFHITCRCGYEFCYLCGEPWKNNAQSCKCRLWDEGYILNNPLLELEDEEDLDPFDAAFSDYDDSYEDSEDFNELNVRFINERSPTRNNPFYKTQICRYWESGGCHRGADCNFAHGADELREIQEDNRGNSSDDDTWGGNSSDDDTWGDNRSPPRHVQNYKTQLCRYWEKTGCNRGDSCNFAHGAHELR